jgi:hypothetical protein
MESQSLRDGYISLLGHKLHIYKVYSSRKGAMAFHFFMRLRNTPQIDQVLLREALRNLRRASHPLHTPSTAVPRAYDSSVGRNTIRTHETYSRPLMYTAHTSGPHAGQRSMRGKERSAVKVKGGAHAPNELSYADPSLREDADTAEHSRIL